MLFRSGADAANYAVPTSITGADGKINPITPTASGVATVANKTYDGLSTATLTSSPTLSSGVITGDVVNLVTNATFADKNVAYVTGTSNVTSKSVNLSSTLTGADALNYNLPSGLATTSTATITPKTLNVVFTGVDKVYNQSAAASVLTADDRVDGDQLTVNFASTNFADANVARDTNGVVISKSIPIGSVTLGGTDNGNYLLAATPATISAKITPAPITQINGITVNDKTYDGNTTASILSTANPVFKGVLGADSLSVGGTLTATFSDKNAGTNKTVTISGLELAGPSSSNYTLTNTTSIALANVNRLTLAVSGLGVSDKVYDASTLATITGTASFDKAVSGDVVGIDSSVLSAS